MRLPVVPQISTKDGVSNKNARLTNCLKESKKGGDKAVVRPGLVLDAQASGVGHGLVVFNNELVSVYGATLGFGVIEGTDGWSAYFDVTTTTPEDICYGNSLFYITDVSGGFYKTTDLNDLVEMTSVTASSIDSRALTAGGGLVCYASGSTDSGNSVDIQWSNDDGATWNFEPDAISTIDSYADVVTLFHTGTRFYASVLDNGAGEASTWSSGDCVTWTQRGNIIDINHYALSFCSGLGYLYAMTDTGACAYSTNDGTSWTAHSTLDATRDVISMVLSNSTLVAFGDIGGIPYLYRSTNGLTFSETSMASVVGGGGSPVALSIISGALVLTIASTNYYTSTDDGASWTANTDVGGEMKMLFAYGGGYTVALDTTGLEASILGAATSGSIPALATITGDYYDFAQSPI
jgi:hypothetical protein